MECERIMAEQLVYNDEQSAELGRAIGVLVEFYNTIAEGKALQTDDEIELLGGYLAEVMPIIEKYPEIFEHKERIAELIKLYYAEDEPSQ